MDFTPLLKVDVNVFPKLLLPDKTFLNLPPNPARCVPADLTLAFILSKAPEVSLPVF